jgi:transposase-like protein
MSGTSYRVEETYIKVGKQCKYLYRAVDREGSTIEFMLSAKRDVCAAKRFFKKMMRVEHRRLPFSISVDKNAAYPEAFSSSQTERVMSNCSDASRRINRSHTSGRSDLTITITPHAGAQFTSLSA